MYTVRACLLILTFQFCFLEDVGALWCMVCRSCPRTNDEKHLRQCADNAKYCVKLEARYESADAYVYRNCSWITAPSYEARCIKEENGQICTHFCSQDGCNASPSLMVATLTVWLPTALSVLGTQLLYV